MVNSDGNTLGSANIHFPPALLGKSSEASATFYPNQIAGGNCRNAEQSNFRAGNCKDVDSGDYLSDDV